MPLFPIIADRETERFLEAARNNILLIVHNPDTGEFFEPSHGLRTPAEKYVAAAGTGTLVSWSINHVRRPDGGTTLHPFGIIELTEGPWIWAELEWSPIEAEPHIGAPAKVGFVPSGAEPHHEFLPVFSLFNEPSLSSRREGIHQ